MPLRTDLVSGGECDRVAWPHHAATEAIGQVDQYGRHYSASAATRVITGTYPARVRAWISRHGGLSRRVLLLRGRELTALYPSCG
jgi:hypothetical protein